MTFLIVSLASPCLCFGLLSSVSVGLQRRGWAREGGCFLLFVFLKNQPRRCAGVWGVGGVRINGQCRSAGRGGEGRNQVSVCGGRGGGRNQVSVCGEGGGRVGIKCRSAGGGGGVGIKCRSAGKGGG